VDPSEEGALLVCNADEKKFCEHVPFDCSAQLVMKRLKHLIASSNVSCAFLVVCVVDADSCYCVCFRSSLKNSSAQLDVICYHTCC